MLAKQQIVPALSSAVHGAIEELPRMPDSPSLTFNRSRVASSVSSTTSPPLFNTDFVLTNNIHSYSSSSMNQINHSPTSKHNRVAPQLDVRKAFSYFDKNRDGKLSIKEFKSVMQDLGYKGVDKRFIKQMFAEATRNSNRNTLSYNEFVEFLESKLSVQSHQTSEHHTSLPTVPKMQYDVETLFNCYDLDKNGYIEPKELRKVMKRLTGEKLSKRDIKEMISVADKNGDGLLDKSEFALLCSAF